MSLFCSCEGVKKCETETKENKKSAKRLPDFVIPVSEESGLAKPGGRFFKGHDIWITDRFG